MAQAVATLTESTCARRGVLSPVSLCARFDAIDAFVRTPQGAMPSMGMHSRTSARRCAASVKPGPSAPTNTATRSGRWPGRHASNGIGGPMSASMAFSLSDVEGVTSATTTCPVAFAAVMTSPMLPIREKGTFKAWPPDTRHAFRYSGSADLSSSNTAPQPNAAAFRNKPPTLSKLLIELWRGG